jgi:hypothetical protein
LVDIDQGPPEMLDRYALRPTLWTGKRTAPASAWTGGAIDRRAQASRLVVPIVVGTRPEAIKLVPIILRLRESEHYEPLVVSTGQHHRMVAYIFELAGISPDVVLWAGSKRSHLNERVASVIRRFDDFCTERFEAHGDGPPDPEDVLEGRVPAAVVVHGDTTSAMAAALAAFHLHVPVLHVEAGLRTGGNNRTPFPEELNRQLISSIAALHFAPTPKNLENLVRENVPVGQIFVTGNTGIDALQWASRIDVRFANPSCRRSTTATGESWSSPRTAERAGGTASSASPTASAGSRSRRRMSPSCCRCTRTRACATRSSTDWRGSTTSCSRSRSGTPPSRGSWRAPTS